MSTRSIIVEGTLFGVPNRVGPDDLLFFEGTVLDAVGEGGWGADDLFFLTLLGT